VKDLCIDVGVDIFPKLKHVQVEDALQEMDGKRNFSNNDAFR
jgi:hypothetical protein